MQFYKVPVYNTDHKLLSEPELVCLLRQCTADPMAENPPIGALTAQHRDQLAVAYELLRKTNKRSVEAIERALFLVCLDRAVAFQPDDEQTRYNVGSHQLIHGGGCAQNSANRWFDKTLQLVVNENGLTGLNYEHSPAEGQPVAVLSDAIIEYTADKFEAIEPKESGVLVEKLEWCVDRELGRHVREACEHVDELAAKLDMFVLEFSSYGKSFIKKQKMSPDSYLQMAMQLAYYK